MSNIYTSKKPSPQEFEQLLELAETTHKEVRKIESLKSWLSVLRVAFLVSSVLALVAFAANLYSLQNTERSITSAFFSSSPQFLILATVMIASSVYFTFWIRRLALTLKHEKLVAAELFDLLDGLMKILEPEMSHLGSAIFRMKLTRLKF